MKASCPFCKNKFALSTSADKPAHFPFCSERCQKLDLGEWASESYSIPAEEQPINDLPDQNEPSIN